MTSKSTGLTLLEAQNVNHWAAKNPDQLLCHHETTRFSRGGVGAISFHFKCVTPPPQKNSWSRGDKFQMEKKIVPTPPRENLVVSWWQVSNEKKNCPHPPWEKLSPWDHETFFIKSQDLDWSLTIFRYTSKRIFHILSTPRIMLFHYSFNAT